MDHIGNLIPDKDKYLSALPTEPASTALSEDIPSAPIASVEPKMPLSAPVAAPETPEAELIRMTLYKIKDQVDILIHLLDLGPAAPFVPVAAHRETIEQKSHDRILEGVFTGDKMRSDDGEIFDVPQNYASKSKLVAGDRMKLTIPLVGPFIYKQIAQVERIRVRGELVSGNTSGQWLVASKGKMYKVLTASITFNKGRIGDEVVLLVPAGMASEWGTVEHIIHREL
jgi:hypothetical protein